MIGSHQTYVACTLIIYNEMYDTPLFYSFLVPDYWH